jgi:hypothetical protein
LNNVNRKSASSAEMTLLSTEGATSRAWAAAANDFASTVRQKNFMARNLSMVNSFTGEFAQRALFAILHD